MAIKQVTNEDGTASLRVRVGQSGGQRTFCRDDYPTKKKWEAAAQRYEADLKDGTIADPSRMTCAEYADRVIEHWALEKLDDSGRRRKQSSMKTLRQNLRLFEATFGKRTLASIRRDEARDWALSTHPGAIKAATQLFNRAIEEVEGVERNPFRGLSRASKGRSEQPPPTLAEFNQLLQGWAIHGEDYAPVGQALQMFCAYTGLRPGEAFMLEWAPRPVRYPDPVKGGWRTGTCSWIDLDTKTVHVNWRLHQGDVDLPKSNETRPAYLTDQAWDSVKGLDRTSDYVFVAKRGGQLTQPKLSMLWGQVKASAGLDFDFYHATKHFCVHNLYVHEHLSPNAIANQMGWEIEGTLKLLKVYGHGNTGWRNEFEAMENGQAPQPERHLKAVGE
jgi:integrase